ncbi:MAG: gamma-glutamylcyclotransferase [Brevinematales bacterium]|nr:gamma-glutamylcyclotransferase [Brevinematales bacterium]
MLLFVYGSLMKNAPNHYIIESTSKFIAQGTIKATLYDLGVGFPGVVEEKNSDEVYGEVYELSDDELDDIDQFEGYNPADKGDSLYIRKLTEVRTFKKETLKAWVYFLAPKRLKTFSHSKIPGGRWV